MDDMYNRGTAEEKNDLRLSLIKELRFDPTSEESKYFLEGDVAKYRLMPGGKDLLTRLTPHVEWWNTRSKNGVKPYSKSIRGLIANRAEAIDASGLLVSGPNFASQDYLSLAKHPKITSAAIAAIETNGVHSAGSAALMGLNNYTCMLEKRIAAWLGKNDATVFPTGWGAGYGTIKTLVSAADHIVIDGLAHACLMEGARSATPNVHSYPHLSLKGLERKLSRIRTDNPDAGILVVTESLFSMDSDTPDLKATAALAHKYQATILVDCAHDLGCIGPKGLGHLDKQGALEDVDVIMGSFSKSFASNGGFVASNCEGLKFALRYSCGPLTFTNSISPIQAAVVISALELIQSQEGYDRRESLMRNIIYLREKLSELNFKVLGDPSPIVPVVLGNSALSRLICRFTLEAGCLVNLVEYPAVSQNTCRYRLQVMSDHTKSDIDDLCKVLELARAKADFALQ